MNPWPGAYCFLLGERLTILKARPAGAFSPSLKPGRVITGAEDGGKPRKFLVAAGLVDAARRSTLLEILELKPEGRKHMTAAQYMHGRIFTFLRGGRGELTCTNS
jgi:methionyl-tRNA formyltransferase